MKSLEFLHLELNKANAYYSIYTIMVEALH